MNPIEQHHVARQIVELYGEFESRQAVDGPEMADWRHEPKFELLDLLHENELEIDLVYDLLSEAYNA